MTKNHYTPEELPKIDVFVKRGLLILLKNISFGGGEGVIHIISICSALLA